MLTCQLKIITLVRHKKAWFDSKMHGSTQKCPVRHKNAIPSMHQLTLLLSNIPPPLLCWGGWGCEVSCGGHHWLRGKTTTGSALDGAVYDIAQILAYLVHNMSRSQLYIAQIGPLSFQAAIEHKPRQVRWGGLHAPVVTEWWPACLHNKCPSQRQLKKTSNGRRSQLNQFWSYKLHSNFKPTWNFLKILYVSFKWYFWQK